MNFDDDNEKKLIAQVLETCAELRKTLDEIETLRKALLEPTEAEEIDAVRAKLEAMAGKLKGGRLAEATLRDFIDELGKSFKRLHHAYRTMYRAWQAAQRDGQIIERRAEIRIIQRVIADMDEQSAAQINKLSALLVERKGLERYGLQQGIDALLKNNRD